jgi:pimeloyl-ACP methyl ester carboxylesterase
MQRRYSEWEIETNGITSVVSEWGAGGRNIVLLHGITSSRMIWSDLGPQLAAEGYHVFASDLRGTDGSRVHASEQVAHDIDTFVADVDVWTRALGLERFVLGGHSFGGRTAVAFTYRYPERVERLVLIAAAGPDAFGTVREAHPELVEGGARRYQYGDIGGPLLDALGQLRAMNPGRPVTKAVVQRWLANLLVDEQGNADHIDLREVLEWQWHIMDTDDQRPLLAAIETPTIVTSSVEESKFLRFIIPNYVEGLPNATFMDDLPGGHDTPIACPEGCIEALIG